MPSQVTQSDKTILVQIEKLVHGGHGLAHDGAMAVFVPRVLPGESVRVRLGRSRKGYGEGRLLEVVTASPDRVPAPCRVFGHCGGCQLQHARPEIQLALKRDILAETLARLGGLTDVPVPPLVPSPEFLGYRSRSRFAVFSPTKGVASLAFYEEGSHRPVPISECPLLPPRLNDAVAHLNSLLGAHEPQSMVLEEVRLGYSFMTEEVVAQYRTESGTRTQAEAWFAKVRTGFAGLKGQALTAGYGSHARRWVDGEMALCERVAGLILRFSDRAFSQANWKLNEVLVETVKSWALEGSGVAPIRVLELYAGVGNFGLPIARAGALVTLVEGNPVALADARYNARVNHIGRCRFRPGPVEAALGAALPGEYDLVLLDPPRTGLSKETLAALVRFKPPRILYLSCDPPTLARDLRHLKEEGYRVRRLQGYDMFPQTAHIETLVELVHASTEVRPG